MLQLLAGPGPWGRPCGAVAGGQVEGPGGLSQCLPRGGRRSLSLSLVSHPVGAGTRGRWALFRGQASASLTLVLTLSYAGGASPGAGPEPGAGTGGVTRARCPLMFGVDVAGRGTWGHEGQVPCPCVPAEAQAHVRRHRPGWRSGPRARSPLCGQPGSISVSTSSRTAPPPGLGPLCLQQTRATCGGAGSPPGNPAGPRTGPTEERSGRRDGAVRHRTDLGLPGGTEVGTPARSRADGATSRAASMVLLVSAALGPLRAPGHLSLCPARTDVFLLRSARTGAQRRPGRAV